MKKTVITCSVLFIIALVFRLTGISFHSLWFDETSTAFVVSQPASNVIKTVYTVESTPPIFFFLEKMFIGVFHLRISEFSLRFLPVVFGALSCVLFFFLFKEIPNKKIEYFAFFLIVTSNFHITASQNARVYSLLFLMVLSTLLLTLQWWKKPDTQRSLMLFLSAALTVQTHYFAVFWIIALFITIFIVKPKDKQLGHYLSLWAAAGFVSFGPLVPLLLAQIHYEIEPIIRGYLMAKWAPGIFYSPIKVLIGAYLSKISAFRDISIIDLFGIVPILLLIAIVAFSFIRRMRQNDVSDAEKIITFSLIGSFVLHIVIGWKVPTIHPQYMAYFLLLLFGCIIANIPSRHGFRISVFVFLIAFNAIAHFKYYASEKSYHEPWREIAEAVDQCLVKNGNGSDPIISEYMICFPLAFYLKNKSAPLYQNYTPFAPSLEINFARLNVFGSVFFTDLFNFNYFPIEKRASFLDICAEHKQGFFIDKRDTPLETLPTRLNQTYSGSVDFALLKTINTNNGAIAILKWKTHQ